MSTKPKSKRQKTTAESDKPADLRKVKALAQQNEKELSRSRQEYERIPTTLPLSKRALDSKIRHLKQLSSELDRLVGKDWQPY